MAKERKPMLVVYDDYTCEMTGWSAVTQEFDLLTPIDANLHHVPVPTPMSAFQEVNYPYRAPRLGYLMEGEVRFQVRERPKPPPPDLSIPSNIILGGQDA